MSYIERNKLQDYPYKGTFFRIGIDESKPLDEQVEEKIKEHSVLLSQVPDNPTETEEDTEEEPTNKKSWGNTL